VWQFCHFSFMVKYTVEMHASWTQRFPRDWYRLDKPLAPLTGMNFIIIFFFFMVGVSI